MEALAHSNEQLQQQILEISPAVRYVAIYRDGELSSLSRSDTTGASAAESDQYEELLVNPTLLKLASQRGDIDCGGMNYIVIRYGNFFQFVLPMTWGHVSVCFEANANPITLGQQVQTIVQNER